MEKIVREYEVYSYDELSKEAKEKALERFAYTNVEFGDWYEFCFDADVGDTAGQLKEAGIGIEARGASFDLDRGSYLYFSPFHYTRKTEDGHEIKGEHKGMWIEDQFLLAAALCKAKVISRKLKNAVDRAEVSFSIDTRHYGGGSGRNVLEINADADKGYELVDALTSDDHDKIAAWLEEKMDGMMRELRREYEYLTAQEQIEETIRANEYQFLADGSLF